MSFQGKNFKLKIAEFLLKKSLNLYNFNIFMAIAHNVPAVYEVRRPCSHLLSGMPYLLYFTIP
jgi:hypothetical protein